MFMTLNEFKLSKEYEEIFTECVFKDKVSIAYIQRQYKLSFQKARMLYQEITNAKDETYLYDVLYMLKEMDDVPTVSRIMNECDTSYPLAEIIFQFYMEDY